VPLAASPIKLRPIWKTPSASRHGRETFRNGSNLTVNAQRFLSACAALMMVPAMTTTLLAADKAASPAVTKLPDPLGGFEARTLTSQKVAGGKLLYRFFTPKGYDASDAKKYPLILFLHGAGERGVDNAAQLKWGGSYLAGKLQAASPCFAIAPQCPPGKQWVNTPWAKGSYKSDTVAISDELTMAIEAVESAMKEFKIDADRVYVMGLSMGGFGTWDAIIRRPDLFAAAVPICGGGDPSAAEKIKHIAIWTFHGGADTTVPTLATQEMVAALKKAGDAEPHLKYTEFPGVGHGSWTPAWETKGLWEWLVEQKRSK
jgi:predicted peptidase